MKEVTEYRAVSMNALVENSLTEFNETINSMIRQGWQPVGPVNMTNKIVHDVFVAPQWVQTMVRYVS